MRRCDDEVAEMPQHDDTGRHVGTLFNDLIRSNRTLDDIDALGVLLPDDLEVLHGLSVRCLQDSRNAARAGHQMEARRFEILAHQLQRRARKHQLR
jgi:hypothetical protein